jgi:beta-glucosidase
MKKVTRKLKMEAVMLCLSIAVMSSCTGAGKGVFITFDWQDGSPTERGEATEGKVAIPAVRSHHSDPAKIFAGWYVSTDGPSRGAAPTTEGGGFSGPESFAGLVKSVTYYAHWLDPAHSSSVETYDNDYRGGEKIRLGYSASSGVKLIDRNGAEVDPAAYAANGSNPVFKDLNKNGKLDIYEDWRRSTEERAKDLAARLRADEDGVHQIAGLMLYSAHQRSWASSTPTQAQLAFLMNDDLRHVLIASSAPAGRMGNHAEWNNNIQALVEGLGYGIPANNSSDPRHGTSSSSNAEYYSSNQGVSAWPSSLGLAATFDPAITKQFGKIASIEYRAMGIATALSPQIDIATDPRWGRFNGTFGEDPKLASAMSKAYVDGFQTTYVGGIGDTPVTGAWGMHSVNAMMKHWPGGGGGEGGRDAHYNFGKYAVFPGGMWEAHLVPFVDGSLSLDDGTGMATAVMPYYTISYMQVPGSQPNSTDGPGAMLNMANAYSDYMINGVLRDSYRYEGVVCTDWNVVGPNIKPGSMFDTDLPGMIWGVDDHYPDAAAMGYEDMAKRAKLLLSAGVDQFGGLNTVEPIMRAYNDNTLTPPSEKAALLDQLEQSAYRLLKNIFNTGLFENPYLDVENSVAAIGAYDFMKAGYEAQLKSTVLLKNAGNLLPLDRSSGIYAPGADEATLKLLESYFGAGKVSALNAAGADAAIVFLNSVSSGGGSRENGINAYSPINLDYKAYTAAKARAVSIAGEPLRMEEIVGVMENRSYKGQTVAAQTDSPSAEDQLGWLKAAKDSGKPVIVVLTVTNPPPLGEVEPSANAIVVNFQSQKSAVLDIVVGSTRYGDEQAAPVSIRPTALLPMQFPRDMNEVETQLEDVPRDMIPYADSEGNRYDFGFGLSYGRSGSVKIDETVNPGYAAFVTENATPMAAPLNKGDSRSAYSIEKRRKVTFDFGYKEAPEDKANKNITMIVLAGDKVTPLAPPIREGLYCTGWFTTPGGAGMADFNQPITSNVVYYALWQAL